jgi:archaellum component FlaF (FlaF/FlaG flagellin family)
MRQLFFVTTIFISSFAFSQSEMYLSKMKQNLQLLDSAKSPQDYNEVAASFERVADAEKTQWLPYYYAAYATVVGSFKLNNVSKTDELADKAQELIDKADALDNNNVEILCVKSMILSSRIMVDIMNRGSKYGPASSAFLHQAMAIDKTNPRPFLLLGQSLLYTPEFWGGGKAKAKPLLQTAVENFKTFKPLSELHPSWGAQMADVLLAQCQ